MAKEDQDIPECLRGASDVRYDEFGRPVLAIFSGGQCFTYQYYGNEAGPPAAAARCPDCRGTGTVVLLTSRSTCSRCGGAGYVEP